MQGQLAVFAAFSSIIRIERNTKTIVTQSIINLIQQKKGLWNFYRDWFRFFLKFSKDHHAITLNSYMILKTKLPAKLFFFCLGRHNFMKPDFTWDRSSVGASANSYLSCSSLCCLVIHVIRLLISKKEVPFVQLWVLHTK